MSEETRLALSELEYRLLAEIEGARSRQRGALAGGSDVRVARHQGVEQAFLLALGMVRLLREQYITTPPDTTGTYAVEFTAPPTSPEAVAAINAMTTRVYDYALPRGLDPIMVARQAFEQYRRAHEPSSALGDEAGAEGD